MTGKCFLVAVFQIHFHLPVSLVPFQGGEYCSVPQKVYVFAHPRYRASVWFGRCDKASRLHTEAQAVVLFEFHHDEGGAVRRRWFDHAMVPRVMYVALFRASLV